MTRSEDWIYIIQPDGEKRIASPGYVKKLLGLDVDQAHILNRIRDLELRVERLESPGRQDQIFKLLETEGRRTVPWLRARVPGYRWYDLDSLVVEGFVEESRSGTHRMYGLPEVVEP